jgi:hypothetical protein
MVEPGLRTSNRSLLLRNMYWDPSASIEDGGAGIERMLAGTQPFFTRMWEEKFV